jgi:hypothetical protein
MSCCSIFGLNLVFSSTAAVVFRLCGECRCSHGRPHDDLMFISTGAHVVSEWYRAQALALKQ